MDTVILEITTKHKKVYALVGEWFGSEGHLKSSSAKETLVFRLSLGLSSEIVAIKVVSFKSQLTKEIFLKAINYTDLTGLPEPPLVEEPVNGVYKVDWGKPDGSSTKVSWNKVEPSKPAKLVNKVGWGGMYKKGEIKVNPMEPVNKDMEDTEKVNPTVEPVHGFQTEVEKTSKKPQQSTKAKQSTSPKPKTTFTNTDVPAFSPEKEKILEEWGINKAFNLAVAAADFYTLYDLSLDSSDKDILDKFQNVKEVLAVQFNNYVDMACGGELRHIRRAHGFSSITARSPVHKEVVRQAKQCSNGSRHAAWEQWRLIRDEYGIEALNVCCELFNEAYWNGSYGGKSWGKAATILKHYLEENINDITFIDTIFGIQHNCGYLLNKVWKVGPEMGHILNHKRKGEIEQIAYDFASKEIYDGYIKSQNPC